MLAEDQLFFKCKLGITEDDVLNLLKRFNEPKRKPFLNNIILFLHSQHALRYFKYHTDQYCEIYKLSIMQLEDAEEYIKFVKSENIIQQVLKNDQFYISFVKILIPALNKICYKYKENESVLEETSRLVQKCAFSFKEFDCYLTDLFENKKCLENHSCCKMLLKSLVSSYTNSKVFGIDFKLFFHSFSKISRNFPNNYKMFIILVEIIGFEVRNEFNFNKIKYCIKEPIFFESLDILNKLLDVIIKLDIDLEYKINNISLIQFLSNLSLSVMALATIPTSCIYLFFTKIIEINPLIVESIINELLTYVILTDNASCVEDYELFMIKILEVFNKSHRIQNLIAKMIPTLRSGIENCKLNETVYMFRGNTGSRRKISLDLRISFSKSVLNYLTNCIVNLSSWQVINLFRTLLYHLNNAVEEFSKMKEEPSYIQILSSLMCSLLQGIQMIHYQVISSAFIKLVTSLEELRNILSNFGTTLLQKEHNHVLMEAFLNISYYWADVYITLEYYQGSDQVKMIKKEDTNFSSCNLAYLHSYLTDKEWRLIAERINNFGEKPCKEIMQKLLIQKLKAYLIFNNGRSNIDDITKPIVLTLTSDFHPKSTHILLDEFIVNNILCKMPSTNILDLADGIIENLVEGNAEMFNYPHVYKSKLIINGILSVAFLKINKLLKQKRKHDEVIIRKALCSKVIAVLPSDMFLFNNVEDLFPQISNIVCSENVQQCIDLKVHESKIQLYLEILAKLPIYLCSENEQKLFILLLFSLHEDAKSSSCKHIRELCEKFVINILQESKFNVVDIYDSTFLLKMMLSFERYQHLFSQIAQAVLKSDTTLSDFETVINFIINSLQEKRCLKFAVITLNVLNKIKKTKITTEMKKLCSKYKLDICRNMVKFILKSDVKDCLLEPYAVLLKIYLSNDENETVPTLLDLLPKYIDHCLTKISNTNIRESLMLFKTILQNKTCLKYTSDNFAMKLWTAVSSVTIESNIWEEYSRLVILITALISNEQFPNIFKNLFKVMEESIILRENKEFYKQLKTWSCILITNVNIVKTNILREQLEILLEKLVFRLKLDDYDEELVKEVVHFEVSIIQAHHIPFTTVLMDFILLTVSILLRKDPRDRCHCLGSSILLLHSLLTYRNPLVIDRFPPYLLQYRISLKELCLKSNFYSEFQQSEIAEIANCAHSLEKLTKNLVEYSKDVARIAVFIIGDILGHYESNTLHPNIKKHLNNCVYSLIALCDHHAVQYLMRVLSNASTEIFKIMFENYKKHYRFTGKV